MLRWVKVTQYCVTKIIVLPIVLPLSIVFIYIYNKVTQVTQYIYVRTHMRGSFLTHTHIPIYTNFGQNIVLLCYRQCNSFVINGSAVTQRENIVLLLCYYCVTFTHLTNLRQKP